jgi:anti-sigma B factor antagonist
MSTELVKVEHRRFNASIGRAFATRMEAAWATGATTVVLDLSEVVSIDSLGVSVLVAAYRGRPSGAQIVLCEVADAVREVLEVTSLYRLFNVYESASAALQAA